MEKIFALKQFVYLLCVVGDTSKETGYNLTKNPDEEPPTSDLGFCNL